MSKDDTPYLTELEDTRLYSKSEVEAREKGLAANKNEILAELRIMKGKLREAEATIARFTSLSEAS